jgi:lipopolysaccharide export system protein LptC
VEIVRGRDTFSADAMDFDNLERVLQLDGRVKGVLVPDAFK